MKTIAIIVAGGSGTRMGTDIPKQFLLLKNKPIVFHTLEKFASCTDEVILVLPLNQIQYFRELCAKYNFGLPLTIVEGGKERFHSVQNALKTISESNSIVAIHDAVRPLISINLIKKSFDFAKLHGNCVVAVSSKDSIRHKIENTSTAVPRNEYFLVQTPQVFRTKDLTNAYDVEFNNFTDDASVFERAGYSIQLIEGEYSNIKITTPEDLLIAEVLFK